MCLLSFFLKWLRSFREHGAHWSKENYLAKNSIFLWTDSITDSLLSYLMVIQRHAWLLWLYCCICVGEPILLPCILQVLLVSSCWLTFCSAKQCFGSLVGCIWWPRCLKKWLEQKLQLSGLELLEEPIFSHLRSTCEHLWPAITDKWRI